MIQTTNEVLSYIRTLLIASPINALSGGIYKKTRPNDSILEDCVFHVIAGTTEKFLQNGALYVKIFYNDIFISNTYYEDSARGQILEKLLQEFSSVLLADDNYNFFERSRELYTEAVPEIHQHYAILKINFEILIK